MISFLKSLFFKFRPYQIYPTLNLKKKNSGDSISDLSSKINDLETRLIETEKACNLRSNEDRLKDLEQLFEKEIKIFPSLERKYIRLEIDRKILLANPETIKKTTYLPWNNSKNGLTSERNIYMWYYRFLFLSAAKEKVYQFRRNSFLLVHDTSKTPFELIKGGKKDE